MEKHFFTLRSRSIKVKGLDSKVFAFVDSFRKDSSWNQNSGNVEQMLRVHAMEVAGKHFPKYVAIAAKVKEDIHFTPNVGIYEWNGTDVTWDCTGSFPGEMVGFLRWDRNQWHLETSYGKTAPGTEQAPNTLVETPAPEHFRDDPVQIEINDQEVVITSTPADIPTAEEPSVEISKITGKPKRAYHRRPKTEA